MKTKLKQIIRKHRTQPDALLSALSTITPGELMCGIVELVTARELRLHSGRRKRSLCQRFYRYHKANPQVGEWFLLAAQQLKQEQLRERYGIGALLEKIRWHARLGIIKTDGFRISNDFQSCYVRYVLMCDPTLCGVFKLSKASDADPLVVGGRAWTDFAKEHEAELWPEQTPKKKAASSAQFEFALGEIA